MAAKAKSASEPNLSRFEKGRQATATASVTQPAIDTARISPGENRPVSFRIPWVMFSD